MIKMRHEKSLSGTFAIAGFVYGIILFFSVLVWFLPEREQVIAHFRVYMVPTIIFGFTGKLIHEKGSGNAEKVGKYLLSLAALSCGAFFGLFIHTFFTGK
ncbi:hypothetical protein NPS29_02085 [Pseudomonas putida]|uniref:hypothetical protein n=1 Tax=Pseudomonas putida TaxID=303 RepID=UPI0023646100|nr:hypothetical protein [Pseudomonas putida]MDD1964095.1 hypothetical protein [Pseudomonas putida]